MLVKTQKTCQNANPWAQPPEFLILQALGGAREFAFLTRTQVMLVLLVRGLRSENCWHHLSQSFQLPLWVAIHLTDKT